MIIYPDFGKFSRNETAVVNFLDNMPILRNGNRSIILEPELFEIRRMPDPNITPGSSYWNLIPFDDWDAQDAAPVNNRRFYSEILEISCGRMGSYLEYTCAMQELSNWIVPCVMEDVTIKDKVKNSLFDTTDEYVYNIVLSDLWGIILSLILYGDTNDFTGGIEGDEYKLYCKVRKAYCAGGYPYGWIGDYPDKVKLLVHFD